MINIKKTAKESMVILRFRLQQSRVKRMIQGAVTSFFSVTFKKKTFFFFRVKLALEKCPFQV